MGDPRKISNKFETPRHPWQKDRLDSEKPLIKQYGLKNKQEMWKVGSKLKNYKDTAKALVARRDAQADKEKSQLITKLKSLNLVESNELDEILGLQVEQLLDRRLQTIVFKKGLARSIKQARQMITHKHISIGGKQITAPSYLVRVSEEASVTFTPGSDFNDADHPERTPLKKKEEEGTEEKTDDKKKKKPAKRKEQSSTKKQSSSKISKEASKQKEATPKKEEVKEKEAETPKEEPPQSEDKKEEAK